jgi:hypothetical protein
MSARPYILILGQTVSSRPPLSVDLLNCVALPIHLKTLCATHRSLTDVLFIQIPRPLIFVHPPPGPRTACINAQQNARNSTVIGYKYKQYLGLHYDTYIHIFRKVHSLNIRRIDALQVAGWSNSKDEMDQGAAGWKHLIRNWVVDFV